MLTCKRVPVAVKTIAYIDLYHRAGQKQKEGRFREAECLYLKVIRLLPSDPPQPIHVQVHHRLGELYRALGQYQKADVILGSALTLARKVYGRDGVETCPLLNTRAVLYKYQGRFSEAARLYRRALKLLNAAYGRDHPDVATIYHNLGGLEHARRRHPKGEPFARKSVALRKRALGTNHPAVAADQAALAALLSEQGKYREAERLLRRSLGIFQRAYGPEHYEVAVQSAGKFRCCSRAKFAQAMMDLNV